MVLSTKEFVEKYGLMAKKTLGQNFLLDANITDKIIRLSLKEQGLENLDGKKVVEVGPGPGGLTQATLRQHPQKMTVIEMDERCLNILAEIKETYPQLEIINGDALTYDWMAQNGIHIVSNLPYNISVVLLANWLQIPQIFESMTLMFQKEVAERICAEIGTKSYGRISVFAQLQCQVKKLFDLPPTCFVPAPKIWSSVLLFMPKENPIEEKVLKKIEMITGLAFGQRRKMIRQSLKSLPNLENILQEVGIEPTVRAENISPEQYLDIAKRLI